MLKLKKTFETYEDFGKSFYEIWKKSFFKYTAIIMILLEKEALILQIAPIQFYSNILKLLKAQERSEVVFSMAIEVHKYIIS